MEIPNLMDRITRFTRRFRRYALEVLQNMRKDEDNNDKTTRNSNIRGRNSESGIYPRVPKSIICSSLLCLKSAI